MATGLSREGQSEFFEGLDITRRGNILDSKEAQKNGVESKAEALNLLNKFKKSKDIKPEYVQGFIDKVNDGSDPRSTIGDFFKGLQSKGKVKAAENKMEIKTAKLLRQGGIFKMAKKDLYQDTKTSDFWKISDDKKHIIRLFKEDETGVSDKSAGKLMGPGVPDGTGPMKDDPSCPFNKGEEEQEDEKKRSARPSKRFN